MNIPILMYHKIEHPEPGNDLAVSTQAFSQQMNYLKRNGYTAVSLTQLQQTLRQKGRLPRRPVVITFDDAYQSVLDQARPVLDQLDFKATVFVVPKALGRHNVWDDDKTVPKSTCMNEAGVLDLYRSGWEIGSHGLNHLNLASLNEQDLTRELRESKAVLEKITGHLVNGFCYPFGAWNKTARDAVASAGYAWACAISPGTGSVTADWYALRRVYVKPGDTLLDFKRKISAWYLMFRAWRNR